jgi:Zn-finger nucleic acid-binding protein
VVEPNKVQDTEGTMAKDLVWACPHCGIDMIPGTSAPLNHWHCAACGFDWVSGEALAASLPSVQAFGKLRTAAASGEASTRSLLCPTCRSPSLRVVKAAGVEVDVCPKCGGVALDPGELRTFKSIRHTPATRAMDVVDIASGVHTVADILKLFC